LYYDYTTAAREISPVSDVAIRKEAIMTAKSSALTGAIDGSAPIARNPRNREAGDARHNSLWRQALAAMSRAQLTNLDSMVHGFTFPGAGRRAGSTR
jgi:hypothetical protein